MGVRFAIITIIFTCLYGLLGAHLYNIQIQKGKAYSIKAESQLKLAGLLEPVRGNIYFTDKGNSLIAAAMNKSFPFIYASPRDTEDPREAAAILGPILGKSEDALVSILSKKNDQYEPLISRASVEQISAISAASSTLKKGVIIDEVSARFYPSKNLGSQVIGFVSTANAVDNRPFGQYGIEKFYNKELSGKSGTLSGDTLTKSEPGGDIALTIDRNIQDLAEKIISGLISDYRAVSASFIVEEPKTGKILAMGGAPEFDPNNYSQSNLENFLNPAIHGVYEPGSIMKTITMSAGIDSGAITTSTSYFDSGSLTLNGKTIKNAGLKSYGTQTMAGVIEHSINTGAAFAERKTGHKVFYNYLQKFGFKDATGIDLPGERAGSLGQLEAKDVRDINYATASFGQGISVTPLQLINAVSAIANGGTLMRPYLNSALGPQEVRRVISEQTAREVASMMISAVDKAGVANIRGYRVAGKTGTAQVPNFSHGGYTDDVINTYVGFAPASNPRFTILIKLDKPLGGPVAALTVVPAFRELAEFILGYYNVPPDRLNETAGN